ncbi:lamin tail domain-containing protein [Nitrosopumilus sp. K4]|uniref:lamin tail domain-containing protein n=1 Tax=Nitrosopumilus sp. K4 TaxID=2795383 RepID=UPI001BA61209|nr:lamin tail domain-containing protein [Nitrosopumilus sp. K4]QUC63883.1 lamin tail domain-containing protein [Nitrosopumilus sp. K4]
MIRNIAILFSVLFLGIIIIPASAQSFPDHVVINEVDLNPPGDDSVNISEWVELYNPTDSKIDVSGWEIASTTVLKKTMTIPAGTIIGPGKFLKYSYQTVWFTDSNDSIELRDKNGVVIDKTPLFADLKNDFSSWQRIYDGYDNDSITDWKFATSNAGSSNGKQTFSEEQQGTYVTLSVDKQHYLFGETAKISGKVSEEVVITYPYFQPEKVILTISGPNYNKIVELYPDMNLNFKTSLNLQKVLGISEGTYNLNVKYAGATSQTSFTVGDKIIETEIVQEGSITLQTDKSVYIPGQTVVLTGTTSKIIPLEGLKFTITNPDGIVIANGNLFPTNGKFTTTVFVSPVKPVYGTYEVIGEYFDKAVKTTFEVSKDVKESVPISLWTDNVAYGLGETVQISGRLNNIWIPSLDLEIIQTKNTLGSTTSTSSFKILDVARIQGDGSFAYSFNIPNEQQRLGDYRITVSKEVGTASKIIHAVVNPDEFVVSDEPLTLQTNKPSYDFGETLILDGFIANPTTRSSFETAVVTVFVLNNDGTPVSIMGVPEGARTTSKDQLVVVPYKLTAIPESSGNFNVKLDINKNAFFEGTYKLKAQYNDLTKIISFDVVDPLKQTGSQTLTLNKEVFGLGEKLLLSGILPPTGQTSVTVSLTKPDGSVRNSGATIEDQRFSWTWTTPISEKPLAIKSEGRSLTVSNYGVYKIEASVPGYSKTIFFKVSSDPENDSLSSTPIFVSTEKSIYNAGEKLKVVGNVIPRQQGDEGLVVPDRVTIRVLSGTFPYKQILESQVYPKVGGSFESLFDLPITVFSEGQYKIHAIYQNKKVESSFGVVNDFTFGSDDDVELLLSADKAEYYPGDVVVLSGKPNKLIYLEKFDVSVIKKSDTEITCGSFFCGKHVGKVTTLRPSPSGSFTYQFPIIDLPSSIGKYEFTVDADFDTKSLPFNVVERPAEMKTPSTIIEKENRITESDVSVTILQKSVDGNNVAPRVFSGSMLTNRVDQADVNLKITSESGVCIIGPDLECLVKESTRKPGQIYEVVEVDGMSLKVRYSGPDVRLEKFDILPESSEEFLSDMTWNVSILKDDQASRFYYKINYKTLE